MSSPANDPDLERVRPVLDAVRGRAPLVHCLSAAVSMEIVADGLLAAGARPMMTETAAEAPHMVPLADALLINLGTLSTDGAEGIPATVEAARGLGLPWVLDPAAVGAAPVRTTAGLTGGAVAVSGAADLLLDTRRELRVARGTPLLTRVTGTGCLLGALTAACLGAGSAPLEAARAAAVWMGAAGELAEERAPRPGSFRVALADALDEVGR